MTPSLGVPRLARRFGGEPQPPRQSRQNPRHRRKAYETPFPDSFRKPAGDPTNLLAIVSALEMAQTFFRSRAQILDLDAEVTSRRQASRRRIAQPLFGAAQTIRTQTNKFIHSSILLDASTIGAGQGAPLKRWRQAESPAAARYFGLYAIASISTLIPGSANATATVVRAGFASPKNST
jgi:hypothetical protein